MSINFSFQKLDAFDLAFIYGTNETETLQKLDAFLAERGIKSDKRYRMDMVVKQHGVRNVSYLKYAQVPAGTLKAKDVAIVSLPAAEYIYLVVSQAEYELFLDGAHKPEIETFMSANNLKFDMSKILALAESIVSGGGMAYAIYLPFRRK